MKNLHLPWSERSLAAAQLFRFLLHWLQNCARSPRLFYAPPQTTAALAP